MCSLYLFCLDHSLIFGDVRHDRKKNVSIPVRQEGAPTVLGELPLTMDFGQCEIINLKTSFLPAEANRDNEDGRSIVVRVQGLKSLFFHLLSYPFFPGILLSSKQ